MLYLIATPIGNLQDISLRALDILRSCDYILCEDTRHSHILLNHYSIQTKCYSYHNWNEEKRLDLIISSLHSGKKIALISDAGTPLISDPGYLLIKRCYKENIVVTAVPGACSPIVALILSGFNPTPFQFLGFFSRKQSEREAQFESIHCFKGTSICFESPKRVLETLCSFSTYAPHTRIACIRELTKQYEQVLIGKADELVHQVKDIKGEIVLVFEETANHTLPVNSSVIRDFIGLFIQHENITKKEAIARVSSLLHMSRNTIYEILLEKA